MSKFRNASNTRYTKSLFQELATEKDQILYSLKAEDAEFPSLYKLYISEEDLTEYTFANKYFENWEHWELISESLWFKPFLAKWRAELRLKLESQSLIAILEEAKDRKSKNRFAANRIILEKIQKATPRRGRPSKEEVQGELKRQTHIERELQEDMKRIMP